MLSVSFKLSAAVGLDGLQRKPARVNLGMISLNSSSRLPRTSAPIEVVPVTLPPGRAKLATKPLRTASLVLTMTMGMTLVALVAADAASLPTTAMSSTLSRMSSPTSSGKRSTALPK